MKHTLHTPLTGRVVLNLWNFIFQYPRKLDKAQIGKDPSSYVSLNVPFPVILTAQPLSLKNLLYSLCFVRCGGRWTTFLSAPRRPKPEQSQTMQVLCGAATSNFWSSINSWRLSLTSWWKWELLFERCPLLLCVAWEFFLTATSIASKPVFLKSKQ